MNIVDYLSQREIGSRASTSFQPYDYEAKKGVCVTPDQKILVSINKSQSGKPFVLVRCSFIRENEPPKPFWQTMWHSRHIKVVSCRSSKVVGVVYQPKYTHTEKETNIQVYCGAFYFSNNQNFFLSISFPATITNRRTVSPKQMQIVNGLGLVFNDGSKLVSVRFHPEPCSSIRRTLDEKMAFSVVSETISSKTNIVIGETWCIEDTKIQRDRYLRIVPGYDERAIFHLSRYALNCENLINQTVREKIKKLKIYEGANYYDCNDFEVDMTNQVNVRTVDEIVLVYILAVCEFDMPKAGDTTIRVNEFHIVAMRFEWNLTKENIRPVSFSFVKKVDQSIAKATDRWYPLKKFPFSNDS